MLRIAITGGLCSGKSAVSAILRELGYPVADADALGHELLDTLAPDLVRRFGLGIAAEGRVDRRQLARLVFAAPGAEPDESRRAGENRRALNGILHPRIMAAAFELLAQWESQGAAAAGVEAALLIEEGLLAGFDRTLLVTAPVETRIGRFAARGGTRAQALARIAAQWPDEKKAPFASAVVPNTGSPALLRSRVEAVMAKWVRGGPHSSGGVTGETHP